MSYRERTYAAGTPINSTRTTDADTMRRLLAKAATNPES